MYSNYEQYINTVISTVVTMYILVTNRWTYEHNEDRNKISNTNR